MKTARYSRTARILHWISAFIIIWATLTGFFLATLAPGSELRALLSSLNISLTTSFLPLFLIRLVYAGRSKKPAGLDVSARQQSAAQAAHVGLYALTTTVLMSGILMMNHDISVFGLVKLPHLVTNDSWNAAFYTLHRYSCMTLFLLVSLHVAAVVRHHRQGRKIMARMT